MDAYALRKLFKLTEQVSAKYGLALNRGKCVTINMNSENDEICVEDGVKLSEVNEAMYLGNELNKDINIKLEISHKMHEVRKTWYKLADYWKATKASKQMQLIIYDAIIRSKLLYGLETIHLTEAMKKKRISTQRAQTNNQIHTPILQQKTH